VPNPKSGEKKFRRAEAMVSDDKKGKKTSL
jgi:hypothetical protein